MISINQFSYIRYIQLHHAQAKRPPQLMKININGRLKGANGFDVSLNIFANQWENPRRSLKIYHWDVLPNGKPSILGGIGGGKRRHQYPDGKHALEIIFNGPLLKSCASIAAPVLVGMGPGRFLLWYRGILHAPFGEWSLRANSYVQSCNSLLHFKAVHDLVAHPDNKRYLRFLRWFGSRAGYDGNH